MRPIIMVHAYKIEIKKVKVEHVLCSLAYTLEYVLMNMMKPYHIENWIIVLDINYMGLFSLPVKVYPNIPSFLFFRF